jgi:hypothetical protein
VIQAIKPEPVIGFGQAFPSGLLGRLSWLAPKPIIVQLYPLIPYNPPLFLIVILCILYTNTFGNSMRIMSARSQSLPLSGGSEVRNLLIGLRRVKGSHSGENIAEAVIPIIMGLGVETLIKESRTRFVFYEPISVYNFINICPE